MTPDDDFAPKLTKCCHVYGITRRGYGASSRPPTGYDDQRLADDVLAVIERGKISKPILIGHSMAGGEMTTLARNHSDRVSALVYMDAVADLEDDPAADPEWVALLKKVPTDLRPQPKCDPVDTSDLLRVAASCTPDRKDCWKFELFRSLRPTPQRNGVFGWRLTPSI